MSGPLDIQARFSEVSVERVQNDVTIATSNRPVFVHDVSGSYPSDDAKLETWNVRKIGADVTIDNQYRPVMVAEVSGTTSIDAQHSAAGYRRRPGADIREELTRRHSSRRSDIDAGGSRATHAAVEVLAERIDGAITVETTYGDVALELPSGRVRDHRHDDPRR